MDEMTLVLNKEQWDTITAVDFEHTNEIIFHTKHGKEVKFVKASAQQDLQECEKCIFKPFKQFQPKRKKGKWVEFDSDEDKYDIIKCSCCKHTFTVDSYHWTDIGFVKDDFKFCPNCGADCRGGQDD